MPKIDVDYETLDGIVLSGLKDMLEMMVHGYQTATHEIDRAEYLKDIKALERVIRIYS